MFVCVSASEDNLISLHEINLTNNAERGRRIEPKAYALALMLVRLVGVFSC